MLLWDYMGERCAYSTVDLNSFQGMHVGLGLGPMSTYMTETYEETDWWDPDSDPYAYHSMYVAMNHPDEDASSGYNFVGYDFNTAYYAEVDMDECVEETDEAGEVTGTVCGGLVVDEEGYLSPGNHNVDAGSRIGFISGSAWWYEDFPNLDLDILGEGFSWTDPVE